MLLTITYCREPATDLGYLLHKNPNKFQTFELTYGKAHVFYTEASRERCTAALLLDIDPIDLAKRKKYQNGEGGLFDYVNDRPYVASSFMSAAISKVFGTAMSGRSKEKQELAEKENEFKIRIVSLPCRGNSNIISNLFEPLGYKVSIENFMLDDKFTEWGASKYHNVNLEIKARLCDVLKHLYVLIPVMDNEKHYWVGENEVEKLLSHGEGWLNNHPEKNFIAFRYFNRKKSLINKAFTNLIDEKVEKEEETIEKQAAPQEKKLNLNQQRLSSVLTELKNAGAKSVIDIGCGEGNLLSRLLRDKSFEKITGVDVDYSVLEKAKVKLYLDRLPEFQRNRIELFQGSLTYRDKRFEGYDAAAIVEVIEHMDKNRLSAFEKVIFKYARPNTIVITTPNKEYNIKYSGLSDEKLRHKDHRFEWTRAEFQEWASKVSKSYGYKVRFEQIGDRDDKLGAPTQMGVFQL